MVKTSEVTATPERRGAPSMQVAPPNKRPTLAEFTQIVRDKTFIRLGASGPG